MEGRDIGTVVFPDADLKIFLTADPRERARRRRDDLASRGVDADLEEIRRQQHLRDRRDTSRADSPLQVAPGAVVVDTTGMTPEAVVERLCALVRRTCPGALDSSPEDTVRSRNHVS
jgi:cytidylate kinase